MNSYEMAQEIQPWMVELRRHFHRHPELSGLENDTIAYIQQELSVLEIPWVDLQKGGLLGFIGDPKQTRPVLLLRADVDALPLTESENNSLGAKICVSQVPGACHACGHDMHTAMLLGAARLLKKRMDTLSCCVILCFERGEEQCTGVESILRYIEAQPYTIDACHAIHVQAGLDSGCISSQPGVVMAGGGGFQVELYGRGGHGSRPDMASNPIDCFAGFHVVAQNLRLREIDPFTAFTYSLGLVRAGEGDNVIPESLSFAGTMRSMDIMGAGERFRSAFGKLLEQEAKAYGCEYKLHFSRPLYEVDNNEACVALVRRFAQKNLHPDAMKNLPQWMASESMGLYLKLWPGALSFVGIHNPQKGTGAPHHDPTFDVDEDALSIGCSLMVGFVEEFLLEQPNIRFQRVAPSFEDVVTRSIR